MDFIVTCCHLLLLISDCSSLFDDISRRNFVYSNITHDFFQTNSVGCWTFSYNYVLDAVPFGTCLAFLRELAAVCRSIKLFEVHMVAYIVDKVYRNSVDDSWLIVSWSCTWQCFNVVGSSIHVCRWAQHDWLRCHVADFHISFDIVWFYGRCAGVQQ